MKRKADTSSESARQLPTITIRSRKFVIGVFVLSILNDSHVGVIKERDKPLGLPGGKPDEGENLVQAFRREWFEETGLIWDDEVFKPETMVPISSTQFTEDTTYVAFSYLTEEFLSSLIYIPFSRISSLVNDGVVAPYVKRVLNSAGYVIPDYEGANQ